MEAASHRLTLGRVVLRLPPQAEQDQLWRSRLTEALERVRLAPALPPRAILVLRRLADPRPGELLADKPGSGRQEWERAAQARLEEAWRRATRPALETPSPAAEAVWFADPAEWLACLSWDLHQGLAAGRWWWQSWLRGPGSGDVPRTLGRLWQAEAQWLPQAVELLYRRHGPALQPLLARLPPAPAAALCEVIARAYALPPAGSPEELTRRLEPLLPAADRAVTRALPPGPAALAALCLAITRAPTALQRYRRAAGSVPGAARPAGLEAAPAAPAAGPPLPASTRDAAASARGETGPPARPPLPALGKTGPPGRRPEPGPARPPAQNREVRVAAGESGPLEIKEPPAGTLQSNSPGLAGFTAAPAALPAPRAAPTGKTLPAPQAGNAAGPLLFAAEQGILTTLGGLWYLVNLLADLDWLPAGGELNGWQKLAGLAAALLAEVAPDPAWDLLAALAEDEAVEPAGPDWLAGALPLAQDYLAARLEQPGAIAAAIVEPATLYLTQTHVDVVFTLEQIRLDIRRAGLDRNPGWVPELGRIITFHYQ